LIQGFTGEFRFLSNFYPAEVKVGNIVFPTSEHAFQALKSLNREDWVRFAALPTPGKAKREGRKLPLRPNWDCVRIPVMRLVLHRKFQHPELREALLMTHPMELEETNTWGDTFWGVCDGVGENWLGKLLMELREELL
jgi:ribA/ribD-fused uncharacterized protein